TPSRDLILLHVVRERIPLEKIVPELLAVCEEWLPSYVSVESGFFQNAIIRQARQTAGMPPVQAVSPEGKSKTVRALPALVLAEAGQVFLPREASWLDDFLSELLAFTGDDDLHDDQVDMTSLAVLSMDRYATEIDDDAGPIVIGQRPQMFHGHASTLSD